MIRQSQVDKILRPAREHQDATQRGDAAGARQATARVQRAFDNATGEEQVAAAVDFISNPPRRSR